MTWLTDRRLAWIAVAMAGFALILGIVHANARVPPEGEAHNGRGFP